MYNIRVNVIVNLKIKYVVILRCLIFVEVVYNIVFGFGCREFVDIVLVFFVMFFFVWLD